nr:hypothetical protein [Clostridium neonatale]DAW05987.1 MAG TPA: hypothetical protein [Caudoviricetes sp.]
MEKIKNKNVDEVLKGQLKEIDFEYLAELADLIEEKLDRDGGDSLNDKMVTFDITLYSTMQERALEMIKAERKLKDILKNEENIINEKLEDFDLEGISTVKEKRENLTRVFIEGELSEEDFASQMDEILKFDEDVMCAWGSRRIWNNKFLDNEGNIYFKDGKVLDFVGYR